VKHLAALLCLVAFSGCLSPVGKVGDPTPSTAGAASFYTALAAYVESDECNSTDEFLKTSAKAAKLRGVVLGERWDAAFEEMGKANVELTADLRAEIAIKVRGMK
jgi:hypothetical protein